MEYNTFRRVKGKLHKSFWGWCVVQWQTFLFSGYCNVSGLSRPARCSLWVCAASANVTSSCGIINTPLRTICSLALYAASTSCFLSVFHFVNVFLHALFHHSLFTLSLVNALNRRRFLYVVNLETPSEAPRKISRQSKWDVGTVQWNPHKSEAHLFAASVRKEDIILCWFMTLSYLLFHMHT